MNRILKVTNLSLSAGSTVLLDKISFEIGKGEIFALVGESGSGKSLTSLAIMRLLPPTVHVTGGDVVLHGSSLFVLPEFEMQKIRGRSVAMIFQEPMSALNPVMTVGEQVAEVIRLHLGLKKEAVKAKVISLFEEVSLGTPEEHYRRYPHQLSGGQKQRVMIAMALACEPDLLIADEPTTALDVTIQAQVLTLLKRIRKKRRLSILFITHDMGVVSQMADRVAVMKEGTLLETAERNRFFGGAEHPYSRQLLNDASAMQAREKKNDMTAETLLEVKDLKVYFPVKKGFFQKTAGYIKAVDGVTFRIPKGKTLALVGESGSGKSTIGQAILRLVDANGGKIDYRGVNIAALKEKSLKAYRSKIQVVFQDPYSALNPRMTVGEIIREGMVSLKVGVQDKTVQDKRIIALLEKVGLPGTYRSRYPHEFSGGQRQRIGIARALAVEPELIICDEPTSALDVTVRAQVLALLKKLQEETGVSYLFITHDLSIIPAIADRVAVMKEGRLVEQGSVESVLKNPQHDYTKLLLASAPKIEIFRHPEYQPDLTKEE
ncbi:dipeptide ABC transporter ATP-binding protein [Sulfurovum sp.]|uniref:ABC transporter ATP-binding protein n=1 Tax=Sulfurovum sp. TaxID=1969726 RepID=UPI0025F5D82E|nr:dipeptide ABC transporter ATP-binding protein [Sulfurovum sp.]